MKKIILLMIFFLTAGNGFSMTDYLKLGNTMGVPGICNSVSQGVEALFWNPANLNEINDLEVMAMYSLLYQDMQFYGAGAVKKFDKPGTFGLGVLMFSSGDIPIPVYQNDEYQDSDKSYSANSYCINLSYSRSLIKNILSGIAIKGLSCSMGEERSGLMIGTDIGLSYRGLYKDLDLYGVLRNISIVKGKYISEDVSLPAEAVLSIDYRIELGQKDKYDFKPMVEFGKEFNGNWKADMGLEIGVWRIMKIGAGYRLTRDKGNLTIGGGIIYHELEVNYNWTGFGELGNVHSIGLIYRSESIIPELPAFHR